MTNYDLWYSVLNQHKVWIPKSTWETSECYPLDLITKEGAVPIEQMDLGWRINVIRFLWNKSIGICEYKAKTAEIKDVRYVHKNWENLVNNTQARKEWFSHLPLILALSSGNYYFAKVRYSKVKEVPMIGCVFPGCEEQAEVIRTVKNDLPRELEKGYCLFHSKTKLLEDIHKGYKVKYRVGRKRNVWINYVYDTSSRCGIPSCINTSKFRKKWGNETVTRVCGDHFEYSISDSGLEYISVESPGNNLDIILNTCNKQMPRYE